jgi:hypothetical protein
VQGELGDVLAVLKLGSYVFEVVVPHILHAEDIYIGVLVGGVADSIEDLLGVFFAFLFDLG